MTKGHSCPECQGMLYYPTVKGEYGVYDTLYYICQSCGKKFNPKAIIKTRRWVNFTKMDNRWIVDEGQELEK